MFGGDESRIYVEAARPHREIVEAASEPEATHLRHSKAPAVGAIARGVLLKQKNAVTKALELTVACV